MKTFSLHLIRHGLTQANLDGIYVGGGMDVPVCEEGVAQLKSLAAQYEYPNVGMVFSSPMQRALQTADILYPQVQKRLVIEGLRECLFGQFEGQSAQVLMQDESFRMWLDPKSGYTPNGGESGEEFAKRTAKTLIEIMRYMASQDITQAACITHGGVIMSMLAQRAFPQKPPAMWMAHNGCGYTLKASAAMLMRDEMVEAVNILPHGYLEE